MELFTNIKTPILDLGSGTGNDTLYLSEKGYSVIACDFSNEALENVKKYIPAAQAKLLDISKKLPFYDNMFEIIIEFFSSDFNIS